jgi:hypothetical protein
MSRLFLIPTVRNKKCAVVKADSTYCTAEGIYCKSSHIEASIKKSSLLLLLRHCKTSSLQRWILNEDRIIRVSDTCVKIKPLKTNGSYISAALTISNSAFCIYGFSMILIVSVNRYYFPEQLKKIDICIGERLCSLLNPLLQSIRSWTSSSLIPLF